MNELQILKERGYLTLREVLPVRAFDVLIGELEDIISVTANELSVAGYLNDLCAGEPFERRLASLSKFEKAKLPLWRSVQGKHHKSAGLFQIITHPSLLDCVAKFIGNEILAHPQFNIRAVLPNQLENTAPWHQDLGYLDETATKTFTVNFWLPLQNTNREKGALEVIERSHDCGLLRHVESPNGYYGIPDANLPPGRKVVCEVPRGGALVMLPTTVHRAMINQTTSVRWSLDIRYCKTGAPTGWDIPGFVCRSLLNPDQVAKSHRDWQMIMMKRGSLEDDAPGRLGIQDWTQLGLTSDKTPVYLHLFLDSYSRLAIAELRLSKDSENCADFFNTQVRPLFESLGVRMGRVITRPTAEYNDEDSGSVFHLVLRKQEIDHEFTDMIAQERNILCSEFTGVLTNELGFKLREDFSAAEIPILQKQLDECLNYYNKIRTHKRRGRPPYLAIVHALCAKGRSAGQNMAAVEADRTGGDS